MIFFVNFVRSFPWSSSSCMQISLLDSQDLLYSASCPSNQTGTQCQLIGCGTLNKELLCLESGHVSKHNLVCLWLQLPHIVRRQVCEPPFRFPLLPGPGSPGPPCSDLSFLLKRPVCTEMVSPSTAPHLEWSEMSRLLTMKADGL